MFDGLNKLIFDRSKLVLAYLHQILDIFIILFVLKMTISGTDAKIFGWCCIEWSIILPFEIYFFSNELITLFTNLEIDN